MKVANILCESYILLYGVLKYNSIYKEFQPRFQMFQRALKIFTI